jgi:hypothetical protein
MIDGLVPDGLRVRIAALLLSALPADLRQDEFKDLVKTSVRKVQRYCAYQTGREALGLAWR